jgi:hypothetical protein
MQHLSKYYPFDEHGYKEFFESEYGIKLGSINFEESCRLFDAFNMLPKKFFIGTIKLIEIDPSLGKPLKVYPNHGRWEEDFKAMYLNPEVLKHEPTESIHLILHETGHAIDAGMDNISLKKAWRNMSGWTQSPPGITQQEKSNQAYLEHDDYRRLKIEEDQQLLVSNWWYDKDAHFVREYASRNPKEDFAESFAYYVMRELNRFKDCPEKARFIRDEVINK